MGLDLCKNAHHFNTSLMCICVTPIILHNSSNLAYGSDLVKMFANCSFVLEYFVCFSFLNKVILNIYMLGLVMEY